MATSLLCETVTGRTMSALLAARDASCADMVELRLDGVADVDVRGALEGRALPAIVTCRPAWEGGRFDGSEEERHRLLAAAFREGAEYVDVEWKADFVDLLRADPRRLIVSSHDFTGVPADLGDRVRAMRGTGAAVVKTAVTPCALRELLPLQAIARSGDAVVVGMGDIGLPSRVLASRFGSRWTYAGEGAAPGQLPAARMLTEFRFRAIGAGTALYGLVGTNVVQSLSPAMHNAAFAAAGLDAVYVPMLAADFDDFLAFAAALDVIGASVTIPFKRDALRSARAADEASQLAGAANTLRRLDGGWDAINTDGAGFLDPLDALAISLDGVRASILGAGGSARAVALALASRGARVVVHARRAAQASEVAASLGVQAGPWPPVAGSWDMLVNCTPLGGATQPDDSPLAEGPFDGRVVYDLTYGPTEAPLVREARAAGCVALDGLAMLVGQAERQFEWWTGSRPAPGVMRAAARRELRARRMTMEPARLAVGR